MKLQAFISAHRDELRTFIGRALGHVPRTASCYCPKNGTDHYHDAPKLTDRDLREWILNDEGLYDWARSEGCKV